MSIHCSFISPRPLSVSADREGEVWDGLLIHTRLGTQAGHLMSDEWRGERRNGRFLPLSLFP